MLRLTLPSLVKTNGEMIIRHRAWALAAAILLVPALVAAVEVGRPAPAFELPTLTGNQRVSLQSLKGKVVVVDFWASWCSPCIKAFPELDSIQSQYGSKGVQVVGISIDEDIESARRAFGSGHRFKALYDAGETVSEQYGTGGALPATFVIDRSGTVRFVKTGGAVAPAELRRVIDSLL